MSDSFLALSAGIASSCAKRARDARSWYSRRPCAWRGLRARCSCCLARETYLFAIAPPQGSMLRATAISALFLAFSSEAAAFAPSGALPGATARAGRSSLVCSAGAPSRRDVLQHALVAGGAVILRSPAAFAEEEEDGEIFTLTGSACAVLWSELQCWHAIVISCHCLDLLVSDVACLMYRRRGSRQAGKCAAESDLRSEGRCV